MNMDYIKVSFNDNLQAFVVIDFYNSFPYDKYYYKLINLLIIN